MLTQDLKVALNQIGFMVGGIIGMINMLGKVKNSSELYDDEVSFVF